MKKIISLLLAVVMVLSLLCVGAYATNYYSMTVTLSGPGVGGVTQTVTRTSGTYLTANDSMLVTMISAMYSDGVEAELEEKFEGTLLRPKYEQLCSAAISARSGDSAEWNEWVDLCVSNEEQRTVLKNMKATLADLASVGGTITATYAGGTYYAAGSYTLTIRLNWAYAADESESINNVILVGAAEGATVVTTAGGTTTVSSISTEEGEKILITTSPVSGKMVNYVDVRNSDGEKITLTYEGNGVYSFYMPDGNVKVNATYRTEPEDPEVTGIAKTLNVSDHVAFMKGDNNGRFRPTDNITRAEVAQIFYRLLLDKTSDGSAEFSDVKSTSWYAEAVNTLASKGILKGVSENSFQPDRAITRAEFAAICVRLAGTLKEGDGFSDVSSSFWAADEISTAAEYGWILGYEDGTFAPNKAISRQEAAAVVNRVLYRLGDQIAIDAGEGTSFPDVTDEMWSWYEINEATCGHDHSLENGVAHEYWED